MRAGLAAATEQCHSAVGIERITRYTATFEYKLGVIFDAVVEVVNSRSEKPVKHLPAELRTLLDDLQTLITQGERSPAEAA